MFLIFTPAMSKDLQLRTSVMLRSRPFERFEIHTLVANAQLSYCMEICGRLHIRARLMDCFLLQFGQNV